MSRNKYKDNDIIEFKERLARLLKELKMTQSAIAKAIGVSQPAFSYYLKGKEIPSIIIIINMSLMFNVELNWLLLGEGPMFRGEVQTNTKETPVKDKPKKNLKKWVDYFWTMANSDERAWLIVEMKRKFPEFAEWLKKMEECQGEDKCRLEDIA